MTFNVVAVAGAGTMGHAIAQVLAQKGFNVLLLDEKAQVDKALARMATNLDLLHEAGLAAPSFADVKSHIYPVESIEALKDAEVVFEAIPEKRALKQQFFQAAEKVVTADTILASNTSTIRIEELSVGLLHPQRVIGVHWMIPTYIRPLVEVTPSSTTSPEVVKTMMTFLHYLGKKAILAKDIPGFIVNRMQIAVFEAALSLLAEGIAPEDIDQAWTEHLGIRYTLTGPMAAMDEMGLDTIAYAFEYLEGALGRKLEGKGLLEAKNQENALGLKSGKGFYDYHNQDVLQLLHEREKKLVWLFQQLGIPL